MVESIHFHPFITAIIVIIINFRQGWEVVVIYVTWLILKFLLRNR